MKSKSEIAKYISIVGHPLITVPMIVVIGLFHYQDFNSALFVSILVVCGTIIPLTIKMYRNTQNGVYSNFDVSNQAERKSWYFFALALMFVLVLILFFTGQPFALQVSFLLAALLLLTSQVVNYIVKSSLHVSFNVFLSFLLLSISFAIACGFFLFILLIAWSRIELKRHTMKETIVGAVLGLIFGLLLYNTLIAHQ
jgi:membrane-associated phospholipid phosphatase